MDGTGILFKPFLELLSGFDAQVITLPASGDQDYQTLSNYVSARLPEEDFVLIAESFSGPIAASLSSSNKPHLRGVVFVATFLSSPNQLLLSIAKLMPIKLLASLPLSSYIQRRLFFGNTTNKDLMSLFKEALDNLSGELIKSRVDSIRSFKYMEEKSDIPCIYLRAVSDRLIPGNKALEFRSYFSKIALENIDGPHFLLQASPETCFEKLSEFIKTLNKDNK